MSNHVDVSISKKENLLIEAYPGTGKTLSYLIPAAKYILDNKRSGKKDSRIIISTNSISLQNQIIKKDWPIVCSVLEKVGLKFYKFDIYDKCGDEQYNWYNISKKQYLTLMMIWKNI